MGNPSSAPAVLRLPQGFGMALDLITSRRFTMGGSILLAPGRAAVMVLPINSYQPVVPGPARPLLDGTYTLTAAHSGLALDQTLRQEKPDKSPGQQWIVTWNDGAYSLENAATNTWLTDSGGLTLDRTGDPDHRQWKLLANGIGYILLNRATGVAIDVLYGSTDVGQSVSAHDYNGGLNQTWSLLPSSD